MERLEFLLTRFASNVGTVGTQENTDTKASSSIGPDRLLVLSEVWGKEMGCMKLVGCFRFPIVSSRCVSPIKHYCNCESGSAVVPTVIESEVWHLEEVLFTSSNNFLNALK